MTTSQDYASSEYTFQPIPGMMGGIEPESDVTVTQYADANRILPRKGNIEPGNYDSSRTPYMIEIQDSLSVVHPCNDITVMKATQLGITEGANNFICYIIDIAPGPILMLLPTDNLAEGHSKSKLTTTIEAMPSLKKKVFERRSKASTNTILQKDFPGGILFLSGANSPANYRNKTIRYLILDDFDGFPPSVGKEGDPGKLAEKRTDTFSIRKKIYRNSTPTIKGLSRIEAAYEISDQRSYHVPCPFCGLEQKLEWGGKKEDFGIKFERDKTGQAIEAWYECISCHEAIDESYKTQMLEQGRWIAKFPEREKRGYHLSSLYSPLGWVSWLQIVQEFLDSKDDPEQYKTWVNTRLAQVYDEKGSQPEWSILKNRAEFYKTMTVPDPACFITAGVDVQKDRLAAIVRAWGPGEESWLVYWSELFGNPEQEMVWKQLDMLLDYAFIHDSGSTLYISQMAVDAGYASHSVYNYCRMRPINTMATKGSPKAAKPILNKPNLVDVDYMGETIKDGCQLWTVGSDTSKARIYSRLMIKKPGPGFYHFPNGLDDEYYLQLTAEKKVTQFRNGFPHTVWVKTRRNEVLDCESLALVAAYRTGMALINWDEIHPGKPVPLNKKKNMSKEKWKAKRPTVEKFERPSWLDDR